MEVKNPRRILFLGPPASGILSLLQDLTGSAPTPRTVPHSETFPVVAPNNGPYEEALTQPAQPEAPRVTTAGLSHTLILSTRYYKATIPIWIDELPLTQPGLTTAQPPWSTTEWDTAVSTWGEDFLSADAAEVVKAVGAWVLVLPVKIGRESDENHNAMIAGARRLMDAVQGEITRAHDGHEGVWDGTLLLVGMATSGAVDGAVKRKTNEEKVTRELDEWEEACIECGFEFVLAGAEEMQDKDEDGEEKGWRRVQQALEANEWEDSNGSADDFDFTGGDFTDETSLQNDETFGFGVERAQMEREFSGLKMAVNGLEDDEEDDADEAVQVEELERMMKKMQAVKDMTAHMPEQDRRRAAARAVNDIMKDI